MTLNARRRSGRKRPAGLNRPTCTVVTLARTLSAERSGAAGLGDPVLVHDAARPLVTAELAESVIAALAAHSEADAAIAAAPVTNTIKRAGREGGAVRQTLDRGELWSVQTPQVFRRAALERALDVDDETLARATDDAWLIERAGGRVIVVPSPAREPQDHHTARPAMSPSCCSRSGQRRAAPILLESPRRCSPTTTSICAPTTSTRAPTSTSARPTS